MTAAVIRCTRCGRRCRRPHADEGWNVQFRQGTCVAVIRPGCQTPEENAEAEIHYATLEYGVTLDGRAWAHPAPSARRASWGARPKLGDPS